MGGISIIDGARNVLSVLGFGYQKKATTSKLKVQLWGFKIRGCWVFYRSQIYYRRNKPDGRGMCQQLARGRQRLSVQVETKYFEDTPVL